MESRTKKENLSISMKSKLSLSICFLLAMSLLVLYGCSTDEKQTVTNFTNLTMADEFNSPGAPDPTIWGYNIGNGNNGWGNNELQYYTDRSENIVVEDGLLKFTVRQESYEGSNYTSARLLTKGKFEQQYGRFEARIKLPWGQGLWPAFWMLGDDNNGTEVWPQIGEIDIMENRGQEPTIIGGAVHGPGYSGGTAIAKPYELMNDRFDTGFHIFGIEWGENYINYYVDDVLYNQITPDDVPGEWVFNDSFYIIMNVAVGGSYVGSPNSSTVFPQEMLVDYVRVYSAD
ncbi:glycoside hydrolase family 16 protein [Winogradskyella schleiferi]|uniref:glycoside hydrolase family 16 protein n=1 Tax=Winogradskyella schleiferi TaxID=2686078 RepID=UPI0015BE7F5C|nr:glycoside hydrolase family 16 protein [Winogradskyella schleiferi]